MTSRTPGTDTPDLEALRRAFTAPDDINSADDVEPSRGCPEPERIWAAVHGELSAEETHDVIDHTAACPACAEDWRLAREVGRQTASEREGEEPVAGGGRVLSMGHRFRRVAAPLAALAAAAVLVLMIAPPSDSPAPPEFRAGESTAIRSLLPADEPLARASCLLRWSEVEGARYSVVISDAQLAVIAQARDLTSPQFQVPAESLAQLTAGAELYWQVEAVLPDGSSRSSTTFVHRLE